MKILLTGGAGYIGSRLAAQLAQDKKYSVTIFDADVFGNMETLSRTDAMKRVRFVRGDVRDRAVSDLSVDHDCVVHLAGPHELTSGSAESPEVQKYYLDVMEETTIRLAALYTRLIFVSSMRALDKITLYAHAKARGEAAASSTGNDYRIVRFGTVFGGFSDIAGFPNRDNTVPNKRILHGALPDENWKAFVTPMSEALAALQTLIVGEGLECTITNVHTGKLVDRKELETWLVPDPAISGIYRQNAPDPSLNLSLLQSSSPQ